MKLYYLTLAGIVCLAGCASAHAHPGHSATYAQSGNWVLNPTKCPDLVEDWRDRRESRRDEAYDRNLRDVIEDWEDRRESRRDEAVTRCPASAWEWHGPRYRTHYHAPRPSGIHVYFHPQKRVYYRKHGHKRIVVRF